MGVSLVGLPTVGSVGPTLGTGGRSLVGFPGGGCSGLSLCAGVSSVPSSVSCSVLYNAHLMWCGFVRLLLALLLRFVFGGIVAGFLFVDPFLRVIFSQGLLGVTWLRYIVGTGIFIPMLASV